ncbi:MAG TPA: hypothetical protein VGQ57_11675 [Polyangiaceae bacterium]|nr:hypothetical protein [Polyangiaceae bacterium]
MKARTALLGGVALAVLTGRARADSAPAEPNWHLAGALYAYFLPGGPDYVQPTLRADHHLLHLEARYSYEDLLTGSTWVGVNAAGGDTVSWQLTSMMGGVFGRTRGAAFGYEGALGWWNLELYSEGEYLLDFASPSDSFIFNWSEFTLAPVEGLRFGLMAERTRLFSSGRVLERGLLAGASWKWFDLTLHVLNPDDSRPIVIVAAGARFDR